MTMEANENTSPQTATFVRIGIDFDFMEPKTAKEIREFANMIVEGLTGEPALMAVVKTARWTKLTTTNPNFDWDAT